jgi:hypothetical protein
VRNDDVAPGLARAVMLAASEFAVTQVYNTTLTLYIHYGLQRLRAHILFTLWWMNGNTMSLLHGQYIAL